MAVDVLPDGCLRKNSVATRFWWAMVGSNHQPSGYEPPALPIELMALMVPNRGFEPRTF